LAQFHGMELKQNRPKRNLSGTRKGQSITNHHLGSMSKDSLNIMARNFSIENPYEADNGIDIIEIEGAHYNLVILYDEPTYRYHWGLRCLKTREILLKNKLPLLTWGEAMSDGVKAAVDNLDLGG